LVAASTLLISGAACGWFEDPPSYDVVNETDQVLVVYAVNSFGAEVELATVEPGIRYRITRGRGECAQLELLVRTVDGSDYARAPHQMCDGDVWVVTGPEDGP